MIIDEDYGGILTPLRTVHCHSPRKTEHQTMDAAHSDRAVAEVDPEMALPVSLHDISLLAVEDRVARS
jgi:hypothetical protein